MLSGLSVDYYVQLERGNLKGVSESVLNAVANALQLDDAERTHLFDLARVANASGAKLRRPSPQQVRPGLQRVLDAIADAPAWIRNGRADVLAANRLGRALYAPVFDDPARPANTARFTFLNPRRSGCTIPSSATSTSPTRRSTCPRIPGCGCSCTPRSPPLPPQTR
jgi:hypothetical protein